MSKSNIIKCLKCSTVGYTTKNCKVCDPEKDVQIYKCYYCNTVGYTTISCPCGGYEKK